MTNFWITALTFFSILRPVYMVAGQSNAYRVAPYLREFLPGDVVNCAVGGTQIETWMPGSDNFTNCVALVQQRGAERLAGIIWWQGESDAFSCDHASEWAARFVEIARAWRAEFGNKSLRVAYAQLGQPAAGFRCWGIVRAQQAAVVLGWSRRVSTDGIPRLNGVHYERWGYVRLAYRFATAIK